MDEPLREDREAREGELFRLLVENVVDYAIFVVDPAGLVQTWSHGAELLLGYREGEILGRSAEIFFTPEDVRDGIPDREMRSAWETGRGEDDRWHVRKDGSRFWVSGVMTPLWDGEGKLRGFAKIMRDRTETWLADRARREGEERVRHILESISDAFFAVCRDWRFTYLNREAGRLLDRMPGELLGRNMWGEYPSMVESAFGRACRRAADERTATSVTSYYPDHDRWYEVHAYPSDEGLSVYFRDVSERKRREEEHDRLLAETDQRRRTYETALSNTPDFIYIFDLEGRFTYVNAALLVLWGKGLDEALGKDFLELGYPPYLAACLTRQIREVVETGRPVRDETPYTSRLGERQYEYIFVPVLGAGGEVESVAGSTRDITDRKRTEEALRRGEERLRLIVESATDYAIFTMDLDGRVASWNSGARNLLGYEEEEILGRDGGMLFIPEDIERGIPVQEIERALEKGQAENERWHVRKDGARFWASGLLMPLRDGDHTVGLLKIMRDTTEQKRTEQELAVSRERLDLVVNSSEVGLWYCDLPFDTLVWNPKCKEHFGLPPDASVTIEMFYGRIHPDDREATRSAIERSIECRAQYDAEFRTIDPKGRVRWVRAIGQPFYDAEGMPLRFDGISVDVTGRIAQEQALRDADRRKDEFLATLAHELRNPLASISNAVHIMRGVGGDDAMEAERAMAERNIVHLSRLIDDLMDVARITRGRIELSKRVVDLGTILHQAVETARPLIVERRHALTVTIPERAIRLEADPTRLEQVLWNLLNNCAKYTPPGGTIRLSVEPDDDAVVVRVSDSGIGIKPEMLGQVFDMFVQVGEHREHAQGGLGIGLSLVRTFVEMHGGSILAHSDGPGHGSEFVVRLPRLPELAPAESPGGGRRGSAVELLPRRRVMVVDDNVDAAKSLARLLSRLYGQEVRVAHDGPEALDLADEFRPEVVLLDIGLPGMDGNEVARRLRKRPDFENALIVALTGWGQESDVAKSKDAGFNHHLVKPADPDAIRALLAGAGGEISRAGVEGR